MAPPLRHSARRLSRKPSFFLALLCFVSTACGTTGPTGKILFEDPRGTVSLQTISDQSIQASHPINLEPALIARILSGMQVQERERILQELVAGQAPAVPVFSADEIQFLAPRIAKALTTAATGEAVAFLVTSPRQGTGRLEHSVTETTAGSLYAYGLSLYVPLSQYRYVPTQTNHRRLLDTSGLSNYALLFTPTAAQRSDNFHRPTGGTSTDRYLVIDYQLLQQHRPPTGVGVAPAVPLAERVAEPVRDPVPGARMSGTPSPTEALEPRDKEIQTLKDLVIKKELELDSLRKELESTRKQLDSQKQKTTPPSKPKQPVP